VGGGLSFGGIAVSRPYWRQSGEFPMSVREDSSSVAGDLVGIPTHSLVKLIPRWRRATVLSFLCRLHGGKEKNGYDRKYWVWGRGGRRGLHSVPARCDST